MIHEATQVTDVLRQLAPSGLDLPEALLDDVRVAYASPGRAYHALPHVEEVARQFASVAGDVGWHAPREVYLAILYHDAVYVPGRADNEPMSALLARDAIARRLPDAGIGADRVAELVLATARHGGIGRGEVGRDMSLFLDCDMAILGADRATFEAYSRGVAAEYAWLPRDAYLAGRRAFLAKLLTRPRIFLSDRFHGLLDEAARANIRAELSRDEKLEQALAQLEPPASEPRSKP